MAVIALTGGPGAPGATTSALALLLAWPLAEGRKVLLVECDPDGGAVLAGLLQGRVEGGYGLRNLAVADRRGLLDEAFWEQLIDLSPGATGDRLLLPGLTDPAQAAGLAYTWEPLAAMLHGLHTGGFDVLLDLGRSGALGAGAVLARRADCVAVTVRTTLRGLSAARPRVAALREDLAAAGTGAEGLGLLLVAEGPYPAGDVARELGVPVHGTLPHASRTARVLSDGGDSTDRRFVRSELLRAARTVADHLLTVARQQYERLTPVQPVVQPRPLLPPEPEPQVRAQPEPQPYQYQGYQQGWGAATEQGVDQAYRPAAAAGPGWGGPVPGTSGEVPYQPADPYLPTPADSPYHDSPYQAAAAADSWGAPVPGTYAEPDHARRASSARPSADGDAAAEPGPGHAAEVRPGVVPPSVTGQAFASPAGQVFVPQAGPVQVRPGTGGYPPLAGIAPHPAAPEPFPVPTEDTDTQGEVLRAR
ncbi:hypothetical protein [Kitasatospora viridis]|uniref:Cellulose biosynthesis protein BcsQ n=1 Tax=Kitasatospora viridis TaxID=281105 RepID=A0A561UAT4_9ACTN|nr:hypothetical protein [Kitasatospora viridis]TWF96465.1 hypothetical protein FHX73_11237 [Kitasatospora viridis]